MPPAPDISLPPQHSHVEPAHHTEVDLYNRLHFLHWSIEDTQETIRFLDTKAGFCVTLLSGMVAISLEHTPPTFIARDILFPIFLAIAACSVFACLRVIFPTIHFYDGTDPAATPRFFIPHNKNNHFIRNTILNPRHNILAEDRRSYTASVRAATDEALLASMSETVVTISFIRQIKSDRLHTAMFSLGAAILLFATMMAFRP